MIDIVTVVFREELDVLRLQAESIDLFCQKMYLGQINVVINDDSMTIQDIDTNWWGSLKDRVKVIPRQSWDIEYHDNGWLTQQLLKLLAAEQSPNNWSIVLDAKTIFVQDVDLTRIFSTEGKLTWGYWPVIPVFEPAKKIVSKLFDIDLTNVAGPQGVPFVFHNNTVRQLIKEVESRTGQKFADWFQDAGMVTEFILYSGYIQYLDGTLDKRYQQGFKNMYKCCNVCHSEVDMFDRKLQEMAADDKLTVSVHRRAWQQLTPSQQQQFRNLLIHKGITQAKELK